MDYTFANLLVACLSSSVLVALLNLLLPRLFKKNDKKENDSKRIKKISEDLEQLTRESRLDDSQTHLLIMINHYPEDTRAIMTEAEKYFLVLKGDSWMYGILKEWADEHKVNIEYITLAHHDNVKSLGKDA